MRPDYEPKPTEHRRSRRWTRVTRPFGLRAARLGAAVVATSLLGLGLPAAAGAAPLIPVPTPTVSTVTTPGTHGYPFHALPAGALPAGWSETEYFVAGNTFTTASPLPFKTRMLVVRPDSAKRFNGKVIVEWMNVTGGMDLAVDRAATLSQVLNEGYAYVGVTAQKAGVNFLGLTGNPFLCPIVPSTCVPWDPARYGTLSHPGDNPGSFDIFSEVGQALRNPGAVNPLAGLTVNQLIAIGQSQSAGRLGTYSQTIHNVTTAPVYDAFVLNAGPSAPSANLPTITVNSEREASNPGNVNPPADTANSRLWEVAGSAHTPVVALDQIGTLLTRDLGVFPLGACTYPFGIQPIPWGVSQIEVAIRSAVDKASKWASNGVPAPSAPRIDRAPGGLARDSLGNATGGVRLPEVAVPIMRHIGVNFAPGPNDCSTKYGFDAFNGEPAGTTPGDLWDEPASPTALYGNHGQYVSAFGKATKDAESAGFVLKADAQNYKTDAAQSDVGH